MRPGRPGAARGAADRCGSAALPRGRAARRARGCGGSIAEAVVVPIARTRVAIAGPYLVALVSERCRLSVFLVPPDQPSRLALSLLALAQARARTPHRLV